MRKRSENTACRVLVTLCLPCACNDFGVHAVFSETIGRFVQAHSLMRILFRRLTAVMCIHDTHRPMVRKNHMTFFKDLSLMGKTSTESTALLLGVLFALYVTQASLRASCFAGAVMPSDSVARLCRRIQ